MRVARVALCGGLTWPVSVQEVRQTVSSGLQALEAGEDWDQWHPEQNSGQCAGQRVTIIACVVPQLCR